MRIQGLIRSRISLCIAIVSVVTACNLDSRYFGKTTPPKEQLLIFNNSSEPESLDPHLASSAQSFAILDALFDGLVRYHPQTLEPMAGLATHYEVNADNTQFTFYLRGHPHAQGIKLPNTDTLRDEYAAGKLKENFARGHYAPPDNVPARWSDGTLITANDFIYSWRRAIAPETAADYANLLHYIKSAEEINKGKVRLLDPMTGKYHTDPANNAEIITTVKESKENPQISRLVENSEITKFKPEDLGVRALNNFTLQVDLRAPTAFFLKLLYLPIYTATPHQAIEAAKQRGLESSWTQAENMITSGAFKLQKWHPYDRIVVVKNPYYYEANTVTLEQIMFLPITDPTTNINMYKAGTTDIVLSNRIPQPFISILSQKKDFHTSPAFEAFLPRINTKRPPFDNVLLRYALNMAINKKALADFLGSGEIPAPNIVPPIEGYDAPHSLNVQIASKSYDILAYDPASARDLLSQAGYPNGVGPHGRKLNVELMVNANERQKQIGEIIQQQWRTNLGIDVTLVSLEFKVFLQAKNRLQYNGIAQVNWIGDYIDPNTFLEVFKSDSASNGTGWSDPRYDSMLLEANSTNDVAARLVKLAECERYLLKSMPAIPLYFASNIFLQKPYVRGFVGTLNDSHPFKYVWIDTSWKASSI